MLCFMLKTIYVFNYFWNTYILTGMKKIISDLKIFLRILAEVRFIIQL